MTLTFHLLVPLGPEMVNFGRIGIKIGLFVFTSLATGKQRTGREHNVIL